jgi:hypothetical protein
MAGIGGYQRPTSPAPVSGPGALSQRTDGGPGGTQAAKYISGLPYGEGQQMMAIQQSAPMSAAPSAPSTSSAGQAQPMSAEPMGITPLGAPTNMPNQPVTHGANAGPGPGMDSLNLQSQDSANYQTAQSMLSAMAKNPNASPALKYLARAINGVY